jgi:hypothetical protein
MKNFQHNITGTHITSAGWLFLVEVSYDIALEKSHLAVICHGSFPLRFVKGTVALQRA